MSESHNGAQLVVRHLEAQGAATEQHDPPHRAAAGALDAGEQFGPAR